MRISVVTRNMKAGGAERVIIQLINRWIAHDVLCDLILLEKTEKHYDIPKGINLIEVDLKNDNYILEKIQKYSKVRQVLKDIKPDIVLSMPEEIGIYLLVAMVGTKIPIVVSERNDPWVMPNKKITRFLRKIMYCHAAGIIFQTRQASMFFSKKIRKKGVILSNPLDVSRIPKPYRGQREKIIVGVGRLVPQKNFHLLIDAFEDFYKNHNDYRLKIYGDGFLREELKSYAKKLPESVVEFPGVSSQVLEEINDAAMFVLTSNYEGVPNVLIEAMAMGMPVISTDCNPGGAANLINNKFNGIIVPTGDRKGLARAMDEIADNSEFAINIGNEAMKIKERLDSTVIAQQWLDYLKTIVYGK